MTLLSPPPECRQTNHKALISRLSDPAPPSSYSSGFEVSAISSFFKQELPLSSDDDRCRGFLPRVSLLLRYQRVWGQMRRMSQLCKHSQPVEPPFFTTLRPETAFKETRRDYEWEGHGGHLKSGNAVPAPEAQRLAGAAEPFRQNDCI